MSNFFFNLEEYILPKKEIKNGEIPNPIFYNSNKSTTTENGINNEQLKELNFNYFYNSIMDYNSFNVKSYQLNSLNDFNANENIAIANELNYIGENYSTLNLIAGSSTTTSSVSTNSSSLSSSIGVNQIIGDLNNGKV